MQDRIAHLNEMHVHYRVEGHGPDVVMIHGWSSSRRMWGRLSADLAPRFRCWSLDLPGFGGSAKPLNGWYTIPNFTAAVYEFMEAMGLRSAHVVGHSMGGMIAFDLAAAHPERMNRLVVINPVVTGRARLRFLGRWLDYGPRLLDQTLRVSRSLVAPMLNHPLADQWEALRPYRRRTADFAMATAEALLGSGAATLTYSVLPKLKQISAPTLIVLGAWDANVPNSEGHLAAVEVPRARLAVLPTGHHPTDDQPSNLCRLVDEFLA